MLSELLDENKILIHLSAQSLPDAIRIMLEKSDEKEHETIMQAIMDRESLMSTAIGKGVALPRTIIPGKKQSEIIIGMNPEGIAAQCFDLTPTRIIVLYLLSSNDDHATILAESLRLLNDDTLRVELQKVKRGHDFIATIRKWEEE